MQNVVVLGGSNSRAPNSFYAGLCGEDEENLKLYNLSLGGSEVLHKIYNLNDEKYKELIKNADLLIFETNIIDDAHYACKCENDVLNLHLNVDSHIITRNIKWLYGELCKLGKRVLVCILFSPYSMTYDKSVIPNLHEKLCRHYGFNFINFHRKVLDLNLQEFCALKLGLRHILSPIMYEFGKNIRLNFKNFLSPKKEVTGGGGIPNLSLFCQMSLMQI